MFLIITKNHLVPLNLNSVYPKFLLSWTFSNFPADFLFNAVYFVRLTWNSFNLNFLLTWTGFYFLRAIFPVNLKVPFPQIVSDLKLNPITYA